MKKMSQRLCVQCLILALMVVWIPARADFVASQQLVHPDSDSAQRAHELAVVETFMQRSEVRQQLQEWGVDPVDAANRVQGLSDAEVHQLYEKAGQQPAGGMDILGTLIFLFVLLLVTDILGLTKVFPFTRSIRR